MSAPATPHEADFVRDVLRNPHTRAILARLPAFGLPDAWLVAGCLFQTVWNVRSGQPPTAQIHDYDIFYFDPTDLSAQAEAVVQAQVASALAGLPVALEVKNQARVHTWYEAHFGHPCPALTGSEDGIRRFLIRCTCVGVQPTAQGLRVTAPHGLSDLYAGRLQANPLTPHGDLFAAKAASYRARWPWLQVVTPRPA